jgi:photosystem II stability/assembly factor-like uncharacterized protein
MASQNNISRLDYIYQFSGSGKFNRNKADYFAARLSGLYRSSDGGKSWASAFDSLNLQKEISALAVAVSPDLEDDPSIFVGLNGGILRSPDKGHHWESALLPSPPPVISSLAISPNFIQDGIVFAGTLEDGVLRSSDRGGRWDAWNFGLLDLNILCLAISPDFASDETLFVGTQSGIFRSTNGGRAWREVNLPGEFEAVLSLTLAPDFASNGTLFAGTENQGLFRSTDGGKTWQRLAKSKLKEPINSILLAPDFVARPELLILHGNQLLISTDCGRSWGPFRANLVTRKSVAAILCPYGFDPSVSVLVGYADGSIKFI